MYRNIIFIQLHNENFPLEQLTFFGKKQIFTNYILKADDLLLYGAIFKPTNLPQLAVSQIRQTGFRFGETGCNQTRQIRKPVSDSL